LEKVDTTLGNYHHLIFKHYVAVWIIRKLDVDDDDDYGYGGAVIVNLFTEWHLCSPCGRLHFCKL